MAPGSAVMWFRRDLRVWDNPALLEACADGAVLPLFVLDPALWGTSGPVRRAYLTRSLRALAEDVPLAVVRGRPARQVLLAAKAVGAERVHVAADFGPYGRARDEEVERALAEAGIELVRTGSPYAVPPGQVTSGSGAPYRVFSPYSRAWFEHGWEPPADPPHDPEWRTLDDTVDLPDADGTSRMSVHLKWGEVHPRTLLADLGRLRSRGAHVFRTELAWRDFYADVLFARPDSARDYLRPEYARMRYDDPGPSSTRGGAGGPVSRSSTPACASCGTRAGCTTGSG